LAARRSAPVLCIPESDQSETDFVRAISFLFDSLNRNLLPPYGGDWVHAPNFARLAARAVTFDCCYVGSMPCMPARRELHTGRYNFLHCSWGPMEPFDDSAPELLKQHGVHTHLVSDHYHYWEDGGGATYHHRYSTWEGFRGQEGDAWKGELTDPQAPPALGSRAWTPKWRQDWVNRPHMEPSQHPQTRTFDAGLAFIEANHDHENWLLQIESFDPHEPFFAPEDYHDLYPENYEGPHFDWPDYTRVAETLEQVAHLRRRYAALVSMCDASLGRVLDRMDELDLWGDTMLLVHTDHGYLLGEHGWWAKNDPPFYDEVARIPLLAWDPRSGVSGERRQSLVQTIDVAPTLLELFDVERPPDMQGVPLRDTIASDSPAHEAGLFGIHGGHVNCTDGRYVYMRRLHLGRQRATVRLYPDAGASCGPHGPCRSAGPGTRCAICFHQGMSRHATAGQGARQPLRLRPSALRHAHRPASGTPLG
jgi:arylsulfatase A-like enzyme